jgi:hypothetical protein
VNNFAIGCEHRYPQVLRDLTPLEERLISRSQPYGWTTKIEISLDKSTSGAYRKLKKGHICVFQQDLDSLIDNVLPAPLFRQRESIRICFVGPRKPLPKDISFMFRVRPAKILEALQWLKSNNPLYHNIEISQDRLDEYADSVDGVPRPLLQDITLYQAPAEERIQTSHYTPPAEHGSRGDVDPTLESLQASLDVDSSELEEFDEEELLQQGALEEVEELTSSGMMSVDLLENNDAFDKLYHVSQPLRGQREKGGGNAEHGSATGARIELDEYSEPFIANRHGDEFADSFAPSFFPYTFPTLFPWGSGGPRNLDEDDAQLLGERGRNFTLIQWSRLCLLRFGTYKS